MKTSPQGIDFLVRHEGCRLQAYQDTRGIWTIGVGHTASAGFPAPYVGMTISQKQADDILSHDLIAFETVVNECFSEMTIAQTVFDGSTSFEFNSGGIMRSSWLVLYKAGMYQAARQHFMYWDKPPEIIGRRTDEANLIFEGKYT